MQIEIKEVRSMITGKTGVTGIFGCPVGHSLSPLIHNTAFKAKSLDIIYLPFEVKPENLKEATGAIRALNFLGINVTVPHKEAIMPFLDKISEGALQAGAVNTILNKDGLLTGYNTDGDGYIRSLEKETGFDPKGKRVLILGAGGAARGILASLLKRSPERITISNRTLSRATRLASDFKEINRGTELKSIALDTDKLDKVLKETHLLINTTTMGMDGRETIDLPLDSLLGGAVVSDIVYRPLDTAFIQRAHASGIMTHKGLGMLLEQGALSFKIWTGVEPPVDLMKKVLLEKLGNIEL